MNNQAEFEMAVHVAAAFSHVKEAKAFNTDAVNDGALNDAERALFRLWEGLDEDTRRHVDLSAFSSARELANV